VNETGGPGEGDPEGASDPDASSGADGSGGDGDGESEALAAGSALDGTGDEPQAERMPAIRMAASADARRLPLIDPATAGILSAAIQAATPPLRSIRRTDGALPDWIQRAASTIALIALGPVLLAIAIGVRIDSSGPVLFAARRVGQGGTQFTAWKFRTMRWQPSRGASRISGPADPRVTRLGQTLRRTRLDELPQLWNVVRGEMRLIGPRPEDPAFVDTADPGWIAVLALRPGITGLAQLAFHDEASALDGVHPETSYREIVLPRKLAVDAAYARARSPMLDLRITVATLRVVAGSTPPVDLIDRVVGRSDWRLPELAPER
jgi:lipopolysaccharide/colanic/teichoic acid biosynthesis glycosyltransferase